MLFAGSSLYDLPGKHYRCFPFVSYTKNVIKGHVSETVKNVFVGDDTGIIPYIKRTSLDAVGIIEQSVHQWTLMNLENPPNLLFC